MIRANSSQKREGIIKRMEQSLKVALVGAGGIGRHLAHQAKSVPEMTLVGLYDADPPLAQSAQQELEIPVYATLTDLFQDDSVSAVLIATPPFTHFDLCSQALQAGKHVFVEKPMALRTADCDALLQQAQQAGRCLMVGHVLRLFPPLLPSQTVAGRRRYRTTSCGFDPTHRQRACPLYARLACRCTPQWGAST